MASPCRAASSSASTRTADVFFEPAEFAVQAHIDLPRFAVVTPFPSTPLYQRLLAEGRILTHNWELYNAQHVVFRPARMTVEQLQTGIEAAWKHAYSVGSILRRIRHSPAPWAVRLSTNLGYRFYANNLSRFTDCGLDHRPHPPALRTPRPAGRLSRACASR